MVWLKSKHTDKLGPSNLLFCETLLGSGETKRFSKARESRKKLTSALLLGQAAKSWPGIIYEQTEST